MEKVTIRVPATTANLGPGFDSFGCALSLYTDVTFEKREAGLKITGCPEAYAGEDNLCFVAYADTMKAMGKPVGGVAIHIDANIPICRGLGSSAALLAAGAMGANALHGNALSKQELLTVTNRIEGHPDNLAPALFGGLTASLVADGKPVTASFPISEKWNFLALVPNFELSTSLSRSVLPASVSRQDAIVNISHAPFVLKALELGDDALLRIALEDKIHQPYRKALIADFSLVEEAVHALGGAFCLSGAGPTLLCMTTDDSFADKLEQKLTNTLASWQIFRLRVEHDGAKIL